MRRRSYQQPLIGAAALCGLASVGLNGVGAHIPVSVGAQTFTGTCRGHYTMNPVLNRCQWACDDIWRSKGMCDGRLDYQATPTCAQRTAKPADMANCNQNDPRYYNDAGTCLEMCLPGFTFTPPNKCLYTCPPAWETRGQCNLAREMDYLTIPRSPQVQPALPALCQADSAHYGFIGNQCYFVCPGHYTYSPQRQRCIWDCDGHWAVHQMCGGQLDLAVIVGSQTLVPSGIDFKNVALNKPVTSSSVLGGFPNVRATDGNTNGVLSYSSCMSTNYEPQPWVQVDLQKLYEVKRVRVWGRSDLDCELLHGFQVLVDNVLCGAELNPASAPGGFVDVNCTFPIIGRRVRIESFQFTSLQICELEVDGTEVIGAPLQPEPTKLGCYVDSGDRDLPVLQLNSDPANTIEKCADACAGYPYFGLQYSSFCFCGTSYGKLGVAPPYECSLKASGNQNQEAGGAWRNTVYRQPDSAGYQPHIRPGNGLKCSDGNGALFDAPRGLGTVADVSKCYEACRSRAGCTHFTYYYNSKWCSLYSKCEGTEPAGDGGQTFVLVGPPPSADPGNGAFPVNIACNKPSNQSSVFAGGVPSLGNDCKYNAMMFNSPNQQSPQCAHTTASNDPWYEIDLGKSYKIHSIRVLNRVDCCAERLDGFVVTVDGQQCGPDANQAPPFGKLGIVGCADDNVIGQKVRISLPGRNRILTLCEVEVWALPEPQGTISGQVVSQQLGQIREVPDVTINVVKKGTNQVVSVVKTDAQGNYRVQLLKGDVTVRPDLPSSTTFLSPQSGSVDLTIVPLKTYNATFVIAATTGTISGEITLFQNDVETPLARIPISVFGSNGLLLNVTLVSGRDGAFEINVPVGDWTLVPQVPARYVASGNFKPSARVTIGPAEKKNVVFQFTAGAVAAGSVSGTVYRNRLTNPLSGASVFLKDSTGSVRAFATTNDKGEFSFASASVGRSTVGVVPQNGYIGSCIEGTTCEAGGEVAVTTVEARSVAGVRLLVVDEATDSDAGPITGTVTTQVNGRGPLPKTEVYLLDPDYNKIAQSTTDIYGRYSFGPQPAGNYIVGVLDWPDNLMPAIVDGRDSNPDGSVNLALKSKTPVKVDFTFTTNTNTGGPISGSVFLDPNRNNKREANETGWCGRRVFVRNSEGKVIATATTDDAGNYVFPRIPPGKVTVSTQPPNNLVPSAATGRAPDGSFTLNVASSKPVAVPLGYAPKVGTSATITGTVKTDKNTPIGGATVNLLDSTGKIVATTTTSATGTFTITARTPGAHRIEAVFKEPAGATPSPTNQNALTVVLGIDVDVTLIYVLPKLSGAISGTVTSSADGAGIGGVKITITDKAGKVLDTTTSDPVGNYKLLRGVLAGPITIASATPNGFVPSADGPTISTEAVEGDILPDMNFVFDPKQVTPSKWIYPTLCLIPNRSPLTPLTLALVMLTRDRLSTPIMALNLAIAISVTRMHRVSVASASVMLGTRATALLAT